MKKILLALLCVLFAAPCVFAQDIDPALQQAIKELFPPAYAAYGSLLILVIAGVCHYLTARKNGLGHVDALLATLRGTNTPTKPLLLVACLGMLSLSSCAPFTAFLASSAGQATVSLVDLGLNVAAAKGKISPGDNVAIQRGLAIVTNPADPASLKVFSLAELGLSTALNKGLIKQGDALLIQEAGVIIKSAVVAPQPLDAKQPVNVTLTTSVKVAEARSRKPTKCQRSQQGAPACMQLAESIPLYGERVAFQLRTAAITN